MKKTLYAVLVIFLLFSNVAYAKGDKHDKHDDDCKTSGLENAYRHVKNEQAKKSILKNIEKKENKCKEDKKLSDKQRVAADKNALAIQYGGSDTASSVTVPIKSLPSKGANGSTITWVSSDPSIVSHDGKILNRPNKADATVYLKATIKYKDAVDTKWFTLTVVKQQLSSAQKVAADKAALTIPFGGTDTASSVTVPFKTLPENGANGSAITWVSSNPSILSHDGKTLNRPNVGNGDVAVTMTAIITYKGVTDTKLFSLIVKQLAYNSSQKVAADKAALNIPFGGTDTASSVTVPLKTLPAKGANGSTITWVSSAPSILSHDGKTLNRPSAGSGDAAILMTATITYSGVSDQKKFALIVKQNLNDAQIVAADKAALTIPFGGTDTASSVTVPLKPLPAKGAIGSTIIWISSDSSILSHDGQTLKRPESNSSDASVIMTAVISKNGITDLKTFALTVKKR